jgi:hypothetical protein
MPAQKGRPEVVRFINGHGRYFEKNNRLINTSLFLSTEKN